MNVTLPAVLMSLGLFGGMLLSMEAGRRMGVRWSARNPAAARTTAGTLEAAIFGLMGLIIAFSFGGAVSRFDHRRQLIVEEANAIGTAWLRLDVLPKGVQPEIRDLFRRYVDSRLETYAKLPDIDAAYAEWERSKTLQGDIWRAAVAACMSEDGVRAGILALPALNAMIDISSTRTMASKMHPPVIIFALLFGLALCSTMLAGYDLATTKTRSWFHVLGFAAVMAITVYIIIDIEFPHLGLIRVDEFHGALRDLRLSMN